jgi:hypothetical protein
MECTSVSLQIEILRTAYPDFAKGMDISTITPEQLRTMTLELHNEMEES